MPCTLSHDAICATFLSWVRPDNISSPITTNAAVHTLLKLLPPVDFRRPLPYLGAMTEYLTVSPEDLVEERSGTIRLYGPDGFEGMRKAGRLAADILDALVPHVVPGVTTGELDDIVYRMSVDGGGGPRHLRLPRLHQELLHLDQPCRVPRHSRRQGA